MLMIRDIIKDLLAEKTRMVLTVLALAWGTFAISSMLAIGEGLRLTFSKAVAGAGTNLLTFSSGSISSSYRGLHANTTFALTKDDLHHVAQLPHLKAISHQYSFNAVMQYQKKITPQSVLAVNDRYGKIHQIVAKTPGRFLSPIDIQQRRAVIVLGEKSTEELFGKDTDPTGFIITVGQHPFTVIGTMEHKPQLVASQAPDAYQNWIPVTTYESLANPLNIQSISILYDSPEFLPTLKEQIQKTIAMNHGADPNDKGVVDFADVAKQQMTITRFFSGMEMFLGILGLLTLMVAAVGIANVMYASIKRATRQIGVRMAIGAKTYHIILYYLMEALMATFIGGSIGIMMSIGLVKALQQIPMKGKLIDVIGQPHPVLSPLVMIVVIGVLSTVGFLSGLVPALKASRTDPAEALKEL